jgi:hypothetical protein
MPSTNAAPWWLLYHNSHECQSLFRRSDAFGRPADELRRRVAGVQSVWLEQRDVGVGWSQGQFGQGWLAALLQGRPVRRRWQGDSLQMVG